uniref:Gentian CONSTANS homolog n=1 Tax=Gentiana triflora TaxID=55190 RepID=A0A0K2SF90_GENTR|nr:gentian CONSTANS homolog [Gentiana triflora]
MLKQEESGGGCGGGRGGGSSMLKQEESGGGCGGGRGGGSSNWPRTCDTCRSSPSTVYCRADSAYLCTSCDAHIHAHAVNNVASRHERVWVCEACERAPAAFLCKADAASLCTTCDSDIHSANPLARRHQRVPISPIPGILYGPPAARSRSHHIIGHFSSDNGCTMEDAAADQEETIIDEDETASWLLLDPVKNSNHHQGNTSGMQFDGEVVDEYLDLGDYNNSNHENQFIDVNSCNDPHQQQQYNLVVGHKLFEGDGVVPARMRESNHDQLQIKQNHQRFRKGLQFETYPASTSFTNQVAVSCMDVVVPETAITDFSNSSQPRTPKGTIDLFSNPSIQMPQQLNPMDREARVLRYREKKKARKFEKTIRYASRKAYAETRPRIKGRFAKRTNVDVEVDQVLSESTGYGVVPSF